MFHLLVLQTGPSLLMASFKPGQSASSLPIETHRNGRGGGDEEDLYSPDFQVEVGSLRRSELDEVIASLRHVAPSLLCNQLSVNLSCFSWPSGEWQRIL